MNHYNYLYYYHCYIKTYLYISGINKNNLFINKIKHNNNAIMCIIKIGFYVLFHMGSLCFMNDLNSFYSALLQQQCNNAQPKGELMWLIILEQWKISKCSKITFLDENASQKASHSIISIVFVYKCLDYMQSEYYRSEFIRQGSFCDILKDEQMLLKIVFLFQMKDAVIPFVFVLLHCDCQIKPLHKSLPLLAVTSLWVCGSLSLRGARTHTHT